MTASIEKLATGLRREDCRYINNFIKDNSVLGEILNRQDGNEDRIFKILNGKGIFPCEFIDCVEKLKSDKELTIQDFYSSLINENISEEGVSYFLKV